MKPSAFRDVCVIGTGLIPFGKYPDKTLAELGWPVVKAALREADVKPKQINAVFCGTALGGMMAGQRVMKALGTTGMPIINIENACSSSSSALAAGWLSIASGQSDVVVVIGVEKLTKFGGGTLPLEKEDWEVNQGMVMPAVYAMRARRYMHEYGLTERQLGEVAVKAHEHGALNPNAQIRKRVTIDEVMTSRPVAEPFTLWHCCPTGDGAAAVVLCSRNVAQGKTSKPVRILASDVTSGLYTNGFRDMTWPELTARGAAEAYEMAGIGPRDIDVVELHDAFTIAELMYYEAFGLCEKGGAYRLLSDGSTSLGGRTPVNPSGGLLSRGHPVGATGVAQAVEVVRQLQGRAGAHQVENAKIGVTHATGGGIAGLDHGACSIHVFAR
ncbi:MAG TPA: thiolase family protein [Beijerinckiaceae bacterium]|jgi:benzoylsuccinyl-CoA thiolase BbsB subunit|nr:thiolase family protein [Beijerinckiaceae bacterium]